MSQRFSLKLVASIALAVFVSCTSAELASAAGGSWGSSRGGFGSGGGLLGGRTPVRSLLGGIGSRAFGSGGSGGSTGFSSTGSVGYRSGGFGSGGSGGFASSGSRGGGLFGNGGLLGLGIGPRIVNALSSRGRGFGSTGYSSTGYSSTGYSSTGYSSTGGWGSTGGALGYSAPPAVGHYAGPAFDSYAAPAVSYGSTGGLYASSATENYYGQWGMDYLQPSLVAPMVDGAYAIGYQDTGLEYGSIEDAYTSGLSTYATPSTLAPATIYDSSVITGQNILQSAPLAAPMAIETDYLAPVLDYGAVPTNTGIDSGYLNNGQLMDETTVMPGEGTIFGPVDGSTSKQGSGFGDGLPDAPSPGTDEEEDGSTQYSRTKPNAKLVSGISATDVPTQISSSDLTQAKTNEAVLSIALPEDAVVYINGKRTKTKGKLREYVSRKLKENKSYRYNVKAVVERDGKQTVRTKTVRMRSGKNTFVRLDFNAPQVTTLMLKVPADARVLLDGRETKARGTLRTFSTKKLTNEQSWKDYQVEVHYEADGKTVVRKQQLTLSAGSTEILEFGTVGSDRLASR